MLYEKTISLSGEPTNALDAAAAAFSAAGLTVHARTGSMFAISCTPTMWNFQFHPLRSISEAQVSLRTGCLAIHAELDNIARFGRFISIMLGLIDTVAIALMLHSTRNEPPHQVVLAIALILFLSVVAVPLEMLKQKRRAIKAIDKLLNKAANAIAK
jgi:hypothetical protein